MTINDYQKILLQINHLIKSGELEEARKILRAELSQVYIPPQFQDQFESLLNEVESVLKIDREDILVKRERLPSVIVNRLFNQNYDQIEVIDQLSHFNLRPWANFIKEKMEEAPEKDNFFKALLFEALVGQEINIDIKFKSNITINPQVDGSVFAKMEVRNAFSQLEILLSKEPSLMKLTFDELTRYLLITYPNINLDWKRFLDRFVNVVRFMMNIRASLDDDEMVIYQLLKNQGVIYS